MFSNHSSLVHNHFSKAPFDRQIYAFFLDFITIWFLSSFFRGVLQKIVFIFIWLILQIGIVNKNKGQSLGNWAFDLKIISVRFGCMPRLDEMLKREITLGSLALLAMLGLNINFNNGLSMLILIAPLIVDFCTALGNQKRYSQTLHDMVGNTTMIQAQRGFSLDLRIKKMLKIIHKKYLNS